MSCKMTSNIFGLLEVSLLLHMLFLGYTYSQDFGEECLSKYKKGQEDFILDADESVKNGATFIPSPKVNRSKDCVLACCKNPRCNVAFMESESNGGLVKSCFLFDCLYKQQYVCRFVRKKDFVNYVLDSLYESHLAESVPPDEDDRPPVANGGQDQVVQPQDSLTLNGFQSKDDNGIASFHWEQVSGKPTAIMEKTQLDDQMIVSNLSSGIYKFQLTVTDTSGQSDSTVVTVLVLTPEESDHHCMAAMKVGPCRSSFPRWHYNGASSKCEKFVFGGCKGNLNNYLSIEECSKVCFGSTGTKKNTHTHPHIHTHTHGGEICGVTCQEDQFQCANGCCLEKELECDEKSQCSDGSDDVYCKKLQDNFQILLQIPVDEKKVRCTEPPNTGDCRDSFTRWYYNPLRKDCFRFNYGGCHGNDNRFDDKETCVRICQSVTEKDIYARKELFEYQTSESDKIIVAVMVLLALAILLLLGILCYCFLKDRKTKQRQHRANINQLTRIQDTERLVYNSTTKPI
ncbi:kunitz-type protease inhibitor 1a [Aplochiton taeniatus]